MKECAKRIDSFHSDDGAVFEGCVASCACEFGMDVGIDSGESQHAVIVEASKLFLGGVWTRNPIPLLSLPCVLPCRSISKIARWYAVVRELPDRFGYLHPEFEVFVVREWYPTVPEAFDREHPWYAGVRDGTR